MSFIKIEMNIEKKKFISILILSIISFSVNFHYASYGVLPIDTFAFFDTGFRIIHGEIPFNDYWTISGPFIDLLQSFYFFIFGVNWTTYILNGSITNLAITLALFYFLCDSGLDYKYSFFYSTCFAFLANPSMGTPFPDHYSSFLSLISIISFLFAVKYQKKIYWFLIPVFLFLAFFSKQTPAAFIILLLLCNFFLHYITRKDLEFFIPLTQGALFSILLLIIFLFFFKIDLSSFITQYFLYPQSIGSNRINDLHLTFNKAVSTLKFLHFVLITVILIFLKNFLTKKNYFKEHNFLINFNIISYAILLIFHQWITLNFTFIFFLIPILCALIQINLKFSTNKKFLISFLLCFCLLVTAKYHLRFNQERKMLDLENINLSNFYESERFSVKLKGLNWKTREFSLNTPEEIQKLNFIKKLLESEKKRIMFLSNYQFFSVVLKKSLNSPNRWYGGLVAHPPESNPYYEKYLMFNYNLIVKKKIEVIYIDLNLGSYQKKLFNKLFKRLPLGCVNSYNLKDYLIKYDISSCFN